MILVQHALEVELDCFGVEIGTVMELYALSQLERISLAVVRNRPTFSKRGLNFERAVLVANQAIINVDEDAEIVRRRDRMRIKRLRFGNLPDNQYIGRCLRGSLKSRCAQNQSGRC